MTPGWAHAAVSQAVSATQAAVLTLGEDLLILRDQRLDRPPRGLICSRTHGPAVSSGGLASGATH